MALLLTVPDTTTSEQAGLRKELGLGDLVMAQVLCVVGSTWVGIAAKLGRAHVAFWLGAMLLYYVPLAVVVIYLNRMMPLEGGLYQWAKSGFGEMAGFLTAWNLWVYAVIVTGAIIFVIPTDLGYILGAAGAWIPASKLATLVLTGGVMAGITSGCHPRPGYREMAAQHRQHRSHGRICDSAGPAAVGAAAGHDHAL